MKYPITPVPKPRMTRSDRWKQRDCVLRYRAFCDEVRACGVKLPVSGADVRFILPMPASWAKKKRAEMDGKPHQQKPDLSNLIKALEDALYVDDAAIWHYATLCKIWGQTGAIEVAYDGEKK
jgi:Holliday junction resolvase RusA-like endonuclease